MMRILVVFLLVGSFGGLSSWATERDVIHYPPGEPIAYWSFDECEGTTVHDLSGNGYDLQFDSVDPAAWSDGPRAEFSCAIDTRNGYAWASVGSALRLTGSFTVAFWARNDLSEMQGMMGNVVTKHWCQTDDDGSWAAPFALHEEPTNDAIGFNGWPEPTCRFDTFDDGSGLPESPGWTYVALRNDDGASYAWTFLNGEVAWEGNWDNCATDDSMADLTIALITGCKTAAYVATTTSFRETSTSCSSTIRSSPTRRLTC